MTAPGPCPNCQWRRIKARALLSSGEVLLGWWLNISGKREWKVAVVPARWLAVKRHRGDYWMPLPEPPKEDEP